MKPRILTILILSLMLTHCGLWDRMTRWESTYYSPEELIILQETTSVSGFGHGFEHELRLDYVFIAGSFSERELETKGRAMRDLLGKYDNETRIAFYEKMFTLQCIMELQMERHLKRKNWREYTLLKYYIIPDTRKYVEILERNIILLDRNYQNIIQERKKELRENAAKIRY